MAFCENVYYNTQLGSFYEFSPSGYSADLRRFASMRGRLYCFKELVKKGVFLPIFLVVRGLFTVSRAFSLGVGALLVALSFAGSEKARLFFVRRVGFFARDLSDWVFIPFVLVRGFFSLLGGILCPFFYFR